MSQPEEALVEFGPADEPSPRRRFRSGSFLRDRRVVPLAAGLGAIALAASVIAEWQVTTIDGTVLRNSATGDLVFDSPLGDLGGWGAGYLAGLFLLTAATVLTVFGPRPGRVYARLVALSTGGTLLLLVLTVWSTLDDRSWAVRQVEQAGLQGDDFSIAVGRGPWCAGAGLLLVLVAAYLSERSTAGPEPRPARVAEEQEAPDEPFELSVGPATPWTVGADNLDKPN
ncbi:hypothetical protein [Actinoplanes sp. N902-109]|uniref:hypothetical protein n=1 Tax=Actinoplanes sp. (strain N902-109) TaxID=649831 RepID=UPI0003A1F180|nr:hypothetical protein [Actinoplanes sp. N902-109]